MRRREDVGGEAIDDSRPVLHGAWWSRWLLSESPLAKGRLAYCKEPGAAFLQPFSNIKGESSTVERTAESQRMRPKAAGGSECKAARGVAGKHQRRGLTARRPWGDRKHRNGMSVRCQRRPTITRRTMVSEGCVQRA